MTILEEWTHEVGGEGRGRFVNFLPDIVGYSVGSRGAGACQFS